MHLNVSCNIFLNFVQQYSIHISIVYNLFIQIFANIEYMIDKNYVIFGRFNILAHLQRYLE